MRRTMAKASLYTALNLLFFALIGTAVLALTHELTREPIARSEESEKLKLINQIAPASDYDNDIIKDSRQLAADDLLGSDDTTVAYIGQLKDRPSIAVIQATAPDGYGGSIRLIVSIRSDAEGNGKIGGVRVISHNETPGLGDYIEIAKSKWITIFNRKSLDDPGEDGWKVKKDGGTFDYMAGATITPRAVVTAVHRVLQYYAQHRDELFKQNEGVRK
ncbi:MAG TPA: electron transport complex subunit RsxG [Gallionella sp.]|nr:electron transport complex subunit RsxG [Gallionella sp.]